MFTNKYFPILLFISFLYCQNNDLTDDRTEWLLTNPNNIDLLDNENSQIIKNELSIMLNNYKKKS